MSKKCKECKYLYVLNTYDSRGLVGKVSQCIKRHNIIRVLPVYCPYYNKNDKEKS